MRLHGDIHAALHGEWEILKEVAGLVQQWLEEYPQFDEIGRMAEGIETALEEAEATEATEEGTAVLEIPTEMTGTVLVFLNDIAEQYPEIEMAVAARIINAASDRVEYYGYYSPAEETTIFAAPEDPFCHENRVLPQKRGAWEQEAWETEAVWEPEEAYLERLDWGFPEEAEWIPFGQGF